MNGRGIILSSTHVNHLDEVGNIIKCSLCCVSVAILHIVISTAWPGQLVMLFTCIAISRIVRQFIDIAFCLARSEIRSKLASASLDVSTKYSDDERKSAYHLD